MADARAWERRPALRCAGRRRTAVSRPLRNLCGSQVCCPARKTGALTRTGREHSWQAWQHLTTPTSSSTRQRYRYPLVSLPSPGLRACSARSPCLLRPSCADWLGAAQCGAAHDGLLRTGPAPPPGSLAYSLASALGGRCLSAAACLPCEWMYTHHFVFAVSRLHQSMPGRRCRPLL